MKSSIINCGDQRPSWITDGLIERTKRVWQSRSTEPIDDATAVELILSATQLWDTLSEIRKPTRAGQRGGVNDAKSETTS